MAAQASLFSGWKSAGVHDTGRGWTLATGVTLGQNHEPPSVRWR